MRSSCHQPLNLMPLSDTEAHVEEFKNLPIPKWDYVSLTGGESLAPYFHNKNEYIGKTLSIIYKNGFLPVIKTNSTWGESYAFRSQILKDIARAAYRHGKSILLDLSVDEFHNNLPQTANVMADILNSEYLNPAIMIELVGFKTKESMVQTSVLIKLLAERDIRINPMNEEECTAYSGVAVTRIFLDFNARVEAMGRAIDNNISDIEPSGKPHLLFGNCLQIDNENIATVNYKYISPITDKDFWPVVMNLLNRAYHSR